MKILLMLTFLILQTGCGIEVDPRTLWHNRQGVGLMQEKNSSSAQGEFIQALGIDPFVSEIHSNLGLTYLELKQPENALKSFESAEKWAENNQALFISRFNQGVTRMLDKKFEEALLAYQRALDANPSSLETKTNIELMLIQQAQQQGEGEGEGQEGEGKNKDPKDGNSDKKKDEKEKKYQPNQEYKPQEFKGDLSNEDVKKILGELKQQEQKIRGQFYRNELKERPRDKDW